MNIDCVNVFYKHVYDVLNVNSLSGFISCNVAVYTDHRTLSLNVSHTFLNNSIKSTDADVKHIVNTNIFSIIKHWVSCYTEYTSYWVHIESENISIIARAIDLPVEAYYIHKIFTFVGRNFNTAIIKVDT